MKHFAPAVALCVFFALSSYGAQTALHKAEVKAAAKSRVARPEIVGTAIVLVDEPHASDYGRTHATYVALHFSELKLGVNDSLVIHTPDGTTRSFKYTHTARRPFWAVSIPGERALITLHNESHGATYTVDRYMLGLSGDTVAARNQPAFSPQEVCGDDDSKEAQCYSTMDAYRQSRAVARLLINGGVACTGWLVGSQGHLLTNEHCIHDANDAATLQVEMMAEGSSCDVNCNSPFACPGQIVAAPEVNPVTFIKASSKYDYALVKLDASVAQTYGYFQMRRAGPKAGEAIYIPQHPRGVGKRIVVRSSEPSDQPSGLAHIKQIDADACDGGTLREVGYEADTDPGASGAPVVSGVDGLVVALHHCGGCPNHAIPINRVITSLGGQLPASAIK